MQGGHQVSQKSMMTALPLRLESWSSLPSSLCRVKSAAELPLEPGLAAGALVEAAAWEALEETADSG